MYFFNVCHTIFNLFSRLMKGSSIKAAITTPAWNVWSIKVKAYKSKIGGGWFGDVFRVVKTITEPKELVKGFCKCSQNLFTAQSLHMKFHCRLSSKVFTESPHVPFRFLSPVRDIRHAHPACERSWSKRRTCAFSGTSSDCSMIPFGSIGQIDNI